MKIWNTTIGEPLPIEDNKNRLHRGGLLNKILEQQGHEITWWASTFEHFTKKHIFEKNTSIKFSSNYRLELLHGCSYSKNISLNRLRNHWQIGREFYRLARDKDKPDLIFASFPSIELAYYATKYAKENSVQIIVDARDMWPDIFINVVPSVTKPITRVLLLPYYKMAQFVFSNANGITGITDGFVQWGLKYASRNKGFNDRSFYLGYPLVEHNPSEVSESWQKWSELGLAKKDFIISYVGAIADNKIDFSPILEAAKYYKDNSNVKFVLAGEGDEREIFKDKAKKAELKNIIFPGWIDKYQIKVLLKNSSLGLVPLKNRVDYKMSIPNKPIEYFSNDLPVMTSLTGELRDLIVNNQAGIFYENTSEMINWIEHFVNNRDSLDKMAKNCNLLFKRLFDSEQVYSGLAKHLTDVYNRDKRKLE